MRLLLLLLAIILAASIVWGESDYTVIIVNQSTRECKVLEAFDTNMDSYIPSSWVRLDITKEQCQVALPTLQARKDFDRNVIDYLKILSCDKQSNVASLSYFGRGADEICSSAGYNFESARLVVQPKTATAMPQAKKTGITLYVAGFAIAIAILFFLILIKKKRHKNT